MTRRQAAERCGVTPQSMRNWARQNFGPKPFLVDGVPLYDAAQVDAFSALAEVA